MRITSFLGTDRSRVILGAACAGLFLSSALVTPGLAQNAASLSPQKGWAVQKLKDSKGDDYCALSRPYSNKSVLTLARNNGDEYSLAVDLQEESLDSEKPYSVTLQPGPGQLRAYEVMPSSKSAFVVRLGADENFLDALTGSQNLRVQIGEQRYEYEVSEFPSGLNDLDACMTSGGKPAAKKEKEPVKEVKAEEAPKASKAANILNAEPTSASRNFSAKKMTAAAAMPAPAVEAAGKEIKQAVTIQPKEETPAPKSVTAIMADDAPKAAASKVADAIEIKTAAKEAKEPIHAEAILNADAGDAKGSDIKTAKKVAAAKPTAAKKPETGMTPEPDMRANVPARMATIDARAAMELEQREKEVSELRARNDQLRGDLARAMSEKSVSASQSIAESKAQIAELEAKLAAARTDNQNLLNENERYKRLSEDTILGEAKGDWDLEQATKRYNEAEREIQRLALELDREKSSCQRQTAEIEQMLFDPAVADTQQRERLASLEQEIAKLRSSQGVAKEDVDKRIAEAVKAQSDQAQKEKAELQAQIADLQQNLTKAQNEPRQDIALIAEKKALEDRLAGLQQELAAAKAEPKIDPAVVAEKQKLQGQVSTLTSELASAKAAMMALESKAEADPAMAQEVQKLRTELAKAKADAQDAKTQPVDDPVLMAEKKALEQRVASLSEEIKTLRFDLAQASQKQQDAASAQAMQEQMAELAKQRDQANDQVVILRDELEKTRLQFAEKQGMDASRADQTASLKLENERLRTQLSMKDKESTTYRNQVAGLQQDVAQLKSRITMAETQPGRNNDEVQALRREINSLRSQMSGMQAQNNKVVASLKQDRQNLQSALSRGQPTPLKRASIQREPLPEQEIANIEPAAAPDMASSGPAVSQQSIQNMLRSAGLNASPVSQRGAGAFAWSAGSLQGKAVVQDSTDLETGINDYIAQERSRCSGDFASMPSSEGRGRSSYEIACVSPAASMSSSVLFFEKDGSFVAIAHDTDTADMDVAMDARDRLVSQLPGIQSAAW